MRVKRYARWLTFLGQVTRMDVMNIATPSKDPAPLLEALRAQYLEYRRSNPAMQLFALIDPNPLSPRMQSHLNDVLGDLPRFALYQGTGLDDLAAQGPFLVACPAPDGDVAMDLHRSLISAVKVDYRCISWLWCEHDALSLINHLQTSLHARMAPEGRDVWFHFYQAGYLPVLHSELPVETRDYMFGPLLAWWCLDLREQWVILHGANTSFPKPLEALPISETVEEALHVASAPAQVSAWLERVRPDLMDDSVGTNTNLRRLTSLVDKARTYGISSKLDTAIYALNALRHGAEYDEHPALNALLHGFASQKTPLIDAYLALGESVWKEIAAAAVERNAAAKVVAYQALLLERGFVKVPVRVVNETAFERTEIEIIPPLSSHVPVAQLGSAKARTYGPGVAELKSAVVPIPGTKVQVSCSSPTGRSVALEAVISGELPCADGDGLAIVTFDRDGFPAVRLYPRSSFATPALEQSGEVFDSPRGSIKAHARLEISR